MFPKYWIIAVSSGSYILIHKDTIILTICDSLFEKVGITYSIKQKVIKMIEIKEIGLFLGHS